jgi:hypothetical protein
MSKFKLGDKVRVTRESSSINQIGDIGTITELRFGNHARVSVPKRSGEGNWHNDTNVELIVVPKVGDEVICIKRHTDAFDDVMEVGDKAIIFLMDWDEKTGLIDESYNLKPLKRVTQHQLVKVDQFDEYFKVVKKDTDTQPTQLKTKPIMTIHSQILAELNLQPGDIVKVTHAAESHSFGWKNVWASSMDQYIGMEFPVAYIDHDGESGVVLDNANDYTFPAQSLQLVRRKPLYSEVKISSTYTAIVYPGDRIEVGCQTITTELFNQIKAAFESKK